MLKIFRLIALLEGLSFLVLIFIGVPMKYFQNNDAIVKMDASAFNKELKSAESSWKKNILAIAATAVLAVGIFSINSYSTQDESFEQLTIESLEIPEEDFDNIGVLCCEVLFGKPIYPLGCNKEKTESNFIPKSKLHISPSSQVKPLPCSAREIIFLLFSIPQKN